MFDSWRHRAIPEHLDIGQHTNNGPASGKTRHCDESQGGCSCRTKQLGERMIGFLRLIACRGKRSDINWITLGDLIALSKGSVSRRESVPYRIIQQTQLVLSHN